MPSPCRCSCCEVGKCTHFHVCPSLLSNLGKTGRDGHAMGNAFYPAVKSSNFMVSRMCLLTKLAWTKWIVFVLEQPLSFIMGRHIRVLEPIFCSLFCIVTWMGLFGARSAKPTRLYTNMLFIKKCKIAIQKVQCGMFKMTFIH